MANLKTSSTARYFVAEQDMTKANCPMFEVDKSKSQRDTSRDQAWHILEASLAQDLIKAKAEVSRLEAELQICRDVIESHEA